MALSLYNRLLDKSPVITKSITCCALVLTGDFFAQVIIDF